MPKFPMQSFKLSITAANYGITLYTVSMSEHIYNFCYSKTLQVYSRKKSSFLFLVFVFARNADELQQILQTNLDSSVANLMAIRKSVGSRTF